MLYQGQIIECNFPIPNNGFKPHPVLVVSNNQLNELEDGYVGVMISGIDTDDEYSFWLNNMMLQKPMKKKSQVRLHLINGFDERAVTMKHLNTMKPKYVEQVIDAIHHIVLNTE